MTKTVLLIRNAAKEDFGGAETYQVSVAKILKDLGFNPIIVTGSTRLQHHASAHSIPFIKGWWWHKQNWSGKQLIFFPLYLVWQSIVFIWYLRLIIKTSASVLHIQSKDDFIAATLAGRLLNKKVIWTDHMDLRYVLKNIVLPLRNPIGKLVCWAGKYTDAIILISDNEHRLVTQLVSKKAAFNKKVVIVKNGVVDERKNYQQSTKPVNDFKFTVASRIVKNKGIKEAILAFTALNDEYKGNISIRLDIYGSGADLNVFKAMTKTVKNIYFHGHQTNAIEKIANSDVFLLPSYQEGFSIALLEATMLGKAIIASDVDSNSEIISHNKTGILVPVRDITALKQAMELLLSSPSTKSRLEKNARANYEHNFNLEEIVKKQIIPLYNSVTPRESRDNTL